MFNLKSVLGGMFFSAGILISCSMMTDMNLGQDAGAQTQLETDCTTWKIFGYRAETMTIPTGEGLEVEGFPFESNNNFVFTRSCIDPQP